MLRAQARVRGVRRERALPVGVRRRERGAEAPARLTGATTCRPRCRRRRRRCSRPRRAGTRIRPRTTSCAPREGRAYNDAKGEGPRARRRDRGRRGDHRLDRAARRDRHPAGYAARVRGAAALRAVRAARRPARGRARRGDRAGSALALAAAISSLAWLFGARGSILAPGHRPVRPRRLRPAERRRARSVHWSGSPSAPRSSRGAGAPSPSAGPPAQSASIAQTLLEVDGERPARDLLRARDDALRAAKLGRSRAARQEMLPLRPSYTAELISGFRRVGRTTLLGTIVTGIAQGVFAGLGYWICGVPEPVFFGAATAVASPAMPPPSGRRSCGCPPASPLMLLDHPVGGAMEARLGRRRRGRHLRLRDPTAAHRRREGGPVARHVCGAVRRGVRC